MYSRRQSGYNLVFGDVPVVSNGVPVSTVDADTLMRYRVNIPDHLAQSLKDNNFSLAIMPPSPVPWCVVFNFEEAWVLSIPVNHLDTETTVGYIKAIVDESPGWTVPCVTIYS